MLAAVWRCQSAIALHEFATIIAREDDLAAKIKLGGLKPLAEYDALFARINRGHFRRTRRVNATTHRSSRSPLKTGCRTLPSADLARYSISASSSGSTQTPRCAMRLL